MVREVFLSENIIIDIVIYHGYTLSSTNYELETDKLEIKGKGIEEIHASPDPNAECMTMTLIRIMYDPIKYLKLYPTEIPNSYILTFLHPSSSTRKSSSICL